MNTKILAAAIGAALIGLSSCSLFQKDVSTASVPATPAPEQTVAQSAPAQVTPAKPAPVKQAKPAKNKKQKKNRDKDRNTTRTDQAANVRDLAADLAGEWSVVSVGTTKITLDEEEGPYINFAPAEGRFYGSNGCNVLNGSYKLEGSKITFSNVLSTMKYCAEVTYDSEINNVVSDGNTVTALIKKIGNETYLYFNDRNGKSLMTLCRHNMKFLDGNWQVISINGTAVDDEEANMFIDVASLKIHGNTGCNYFNGSILIDPAVPNSISFSGMGVTRMMCPNIDRERTMLVALEQTASAVPGNDNTAILLSADNKPLMTLKRIADKN